jgi:tetratricopeptide (TPR) repeat protein
MLSEPDYARYEQNAVAADKAAMLGDWAAAVGHYRALVALDSTALTLGNLAWATIMAADPASGIALADKAAALASDNAVLLHNAAYARLKAGRDLPHARTLLQRAAALDPASLEIRVRLITVEAAAG